MSMLPCHHTITQDHVFISQPFSENLGKKPHRFVTKLLQLSLSLAAKGSVSLLPYPCLLLSCSLALLGQLLYLAFIMRLINTRTLKLEEFIDGRNAPDYAILSHTWCRDEVLFNDMMHLDATVKQKKGWTKIELTCAQALHDDLQYAWVDTCCSCSAHLAPLSYGRL